MDPLPAVDYRSWDSECFGIRIGAIATSSCRIVADRGMIRELIQYHNLDLMYCAVDLPLSDDLREFRIVDHVRLLMPVGVAPVPSPGALDVRVLAPGPADAELRALALTAGWSSRFRIDRRFSDDQFQKLYDVWVNRSCKREIADQVFVIDDGPRYAGFATIRIEASTAKIGLIAVSPAHQRQGIGKRLIQAVAAFSSQRRCSEIQVVTQSQNAAALALYASAGFISAGMTIWYHFWRDDFVS